jgi:hypothetical protein
LAGRRRERGNVIALGRDGELSCAAKSCTGSGLRTLREWLAGADAVILFGGGSAAPPIVAVSWDAWNRAVRMTATPEDRAAV